MNTRIELDHAHNQTEPENQAGFVPEPHPKILKAKQNMKQMWQNTIYIMKKGKKYNNAPIFWGLPLRILPPDAANKKTPKANMYGWQNMLACPDSSVIKGPIVQLVWVYNFAAALVKI